MRAIVYSKQGPSSVLQLAERPVPEPGPGQVRVRMVRAGVNPTDWKSRAGGTRPLAEVNGMASSPVGRPPLTPPKKARGAPPKK